MARGIGRVQWWRPMTRTRTRKVSTRRTRSRQDSWQRSARTIARGSLGRRDLPDGKTMQQQKEKKKTLTCDSQTPNDPPDNSQVTMSWQSVAWSSMSVTISASSRASSSLGRAQHGVVVSGNACRTAGSRTEVSQNRSRESGRALPMEGGAAACLPDSDCDMAFEKGAHLYKRHKRRHWRAQLECLLAHQPPRPTVHIAC